MKTVSSGIPGLDDILKGGFNHPSTILIAGTAGAGKTTFGMQSLFNSAREEVCMFISAISEPVGMMQSLMANFSFYNPSLLEEKRIRFFNIEESILKQGGPEILRFIEDKIQQVKPKRIVVDPVTVLAQSIKGEHEQRLFLFDLLTRMKSWNILVLLSGEFVLEDLKKNPLGYLVDGIVYLSEELINDRSERHLTIPKMRGRSYVAGRHTYAITSNGISVYPRLLPVSEPEKPISTARLSTGILGLDKMLGGGLLRDDVVLVSGSPGTGKTVMGLHFITEGARNNEPGLVISFEERPQKLIRNARAFGWDLEALEKGKLLKILYFSPEIYRADEHAILLKKLLKECDVKRVFFDGIENLETAIPDIVKRRDYVHALVDFFSSQGITTLLTSEIPELFGTIKLTHEALSGTVDTMILLRQVEVAGKMRKALSILKSRGSDHDKEIREFDITSKGIEVKVAIAGYENVLSGSARKAPADVFREMFGERK